MTWVEINGQGAPYVHDGGHGRGHVLCVICQRAVIKGVRFRGFECEDDRFVGICAGECARIAVVSLQPLATKPPPPPPFNEVCGDTYGGRLCTMPAEHGGDWHDDGAACWPTKFKAI